MLDFEKFIPLLGISPDVSPEAIKNGNYVDARNVRSVTELGSSNPYYVPVKGNTFTVKIADTVAQSKIYAVAVNSSATTTNNKLRFSDVNGLIVETANFTITAGNLSTDFTSVIKPAIQSALTSVGITSTVTLDPPSATLNGHVIIALTNRIGLDYTLTSIGTDVLQVSVQQDAVDSSLAGAANVIGSYDLLGDLFIWSTSQTHLPTVLNLPGTNTPVNINTIIGVGSSAIITTNSPHGLSVYQKIQISGSSVSSYNSTFIVISTPSSTTFTIANNFGNSAGGSITLYVTGNGEIGVQRYDANTDVYTYTRLIKSDQLNFTTQKQIDSYVEQNNVLKSLYWTDDYNVPRVMYYKGAYIQDGFLSFYNNNGQYELDTINEETKLIISNTSFNFSFIGQTQVGGALLSGNWRYAFRFLTTSLTPTQWSELSNPVPVFKSNTGGTPSLMSGDDANVVTTKINGFQITGIIPNLFEYIEMAAINYVGNAIIGYVISRTILNSNTTITLNHTGLETDVTTLDLGSLNQIQANIQTAKNIDAIDNRLILSNLTSAQSIDFSLWTQSWTHSTAKMPIGAVRLSNVNLRVGEYNDPNNVYNVVGYMDNEIYRFAARFKLKGNGAITDAFWIDDIKFDTLSANITSPNRRISHFTNYNLTDNSTNIDNIYVTTVNFSGIDLNFLISGVKASDLIDEILFERAELGVNIQEILFTGVAILSCTDNPLGGTPVGRLADNTGIDYSPNDATQYIGEFPFVETDNAGNNIPYPYNIYSLASQSLPLRKFSSLYFPDLYYGNRSVANIPSINGDIIINYGNPVKKYSTTVSSGVPHYGSAYVEYNGYTNTASPASTPVEELYNLGSGDGIFLNSGNDFYSKTLINRNLDATDWWYIYSPVIRTTSDLTNVSGNIDYAFYYIQYKRPLNYTDPDNCKYGTRVLTKYIPTGTSSVLADQTTSILNTNVYGGDVFTQKTYLKHRFPHASGTYGFDHLGWGGGFSFYSQNRVNTQLNRRYGNGFNEWDYPNVTLPLWTEDTANHIVPVAYNTGYNIKNGINSYNAFDPNSPNQSDLPARIAYSNLKPQDSLVDDYRQFLPLNFKDLDLSAGEINHHANGNGELLTWQPRKFQRQFFNTRGVLEESNLDILIGDGSVLSRDGITLSTYGTSHKWSVIRGKGNQGNDTFYWINAELKKILRFGYDGTVSLAEVKEAESLFANNLTWAGLYDTPAAGKGICGFWDDRYHELGWTMFGKRIEDTFDFNINYNIGKVISYIPIGTYATSSFTVAGATPSNLSQITYYNGITSVLITKVLGTWSIGGGSTWAAVIETINAAQSVYVWSYDGVNTISTVATQIGISGNGITGTVRDNGHLTTTALTAGGTDATYSTFEKTGELYISLIANNIHNTPNLNPLAWQLIPHTNNAYYNEYTIIFSEKKNTFTAFYDAMAHIYLKWKDTYFSPRPVLDTQGNIYIHNIGNYGEWYLLSGDSKKADGYLEGVVNKNSSESNWFVALSMETQNVPYRVDFTTQNQISFLTQSEFTSRMNRWLAPVKQDSTNIGVNNGNTTLLFGEYMRVKLTFKQGLYQKFKGFIVKFKSAPRLTTK